MNLLGAFAKLRHRCGLGEPASPSGPEHPGDTIIPMVRHFGLQRRAASPRLLLLAFAFVGFALPTHAQTSDPEPDPDAGPRPQSAEVSRVHLIGNEDILRMAKAGLGDDVLIQTIQLQPGHYDTNPDDLIALKSAGLSDKVLAAMQAHGSGLAQGTGLKTHSAKPTVDPIPLAAGIDEIGVYYKDKTDDFVPLKTERVTFKTGGALKNILTDKMVDKDMNGHIDGSVSPLKLSAGMQVVIYAPLGTDSAEYTFIQFHQHNKDREFRVNTGGLFHSQTGADRDSIPFEAKKLAPQMYTFNLPADLTPGEYGILPPGSSNTQGIAGTGKIFTFSIPE